MSNHDSAKLQNSAPQTEPVTLEQMIANTCFCKLRESCPDKTSEQCMKHRNIYQEFMCSK